MIELIFAGLFGLIIGSFLNVIIYRLPQQLNGKPINIYTPSRSFCPHCNHQLNWFENIPLISFFIQKMSCTHCQKSISWTYPLIETISAIATIIVIYQLGLNLQSIFVLIFVYGLICLFMIDANTQLLPDILTLPLVWLGLLFNLNFEFISLSDSIIGAIVGYLFLWIIYWAFKLIRKKEGFGYGDFKLMAVLGAWFGWQSLTNTMLISSIIAISYILIFNRKKLNQPFAFGPFLIMASFINFQWGQYLNTIGL
jgi:leader peptidase (prepilin peptidase)/N-methyltransferase